MTPPSPSPGFFRGYAAMNALWLPWNLLYIPLYEAAKRRVYRWQLGRTHASGHVTQVGQGQGLEVGCVAVGHRWTEPGPGRG